MKKLLYMTLCIGGCFLLLPIFIVHISKVEVGGSEIALVTKEVDIETEDIIDEVTLVGLLAKEISYETSPEAIKAQAVVMRTYMARRILGIEKNGAIVGLSEEEMKLLWGKDYDAIYTIYKEAIDTTKNQLILYDNKPIEALYHKASSGFTRDASSVYKKEIPYLKSVESTVDTVTQQIKCSKRDIVNRLKETYPSLMADTDTLETQIQIVSRDQGDYVNALQIGNITISGEAFRTLLELPSAAFKIYDSGDSLIFDVKGEGIGVGLSLNGANILATNGKTYEEIIQAYYTDVVIETYEVQK